MPNEIEQVIKFLDDAKKEELGTSDKDALLESLRKIEKMLKDIQGAFITAFQLEYFSKGRIKAAIFFTAIASLQQRWWSVVVTYENHPEAEIKTIMGRIASLCPKIGQEGKYTYESTSLALWNSTISRRIYIPQGFVGVADLNPIIQDTTAASSAENLGAITTDRAASVKTFTFLATYGIAACVGFILYSKTANRCALAHFDDPFNVTSEMSKEEAASAQYTEKMIAAKHHYHEAIQGILIQAQHGLSANPNDWQVILAPSASYQSKKLNEILNEICRGMEQLVINIKPFTDSAGSILLNLQEFNVEILKNYEERVDIATFPSRSLVLRQALNLPIDFLLYRMARGLIRCDLELGCYIEDVYVTTSQLISVNNYFTAVTKNPAQVVALAAEVDRAVKASNHQQRAERILPTEASASTDAPAAGSIASTSAALLGAETAVALDITDTVVSDATNASKSEDVVLTSSNFETLEHYAKANSSILAVARLTNSIIATLVPDPKTANPAWYGTAVAASAIVALVAARSELHKDDVIATAISDPIPVAFTALAALAAAEGSTLIRRPSLPSRPRAATAAPSDASVVSRAPVARDNPGFHVTTAASNVSDDGKTSDSSKIDTAVGQKRPAPLGRERDIHEPPNKLRATAMARVPSRPLTVSMTALTGRTSARTLTPSLPAASSGRPPSRASTPSLFAAARAAAAAAKPAPTYDTIFAARDLARTLAARASHVTTITNASVAFISTLADLASARRSSAHPASSVAVSSSVTSTEDAANIYLAAIEDVAKEVDILAVSLATAAASSIITIMPKSAAVINPDITSGGPSRTVLRMYSSAAADHHSVSEAVIRDSASGSAIEHDGADGEDNAAVVDKTKDPNNTSSSPKP